MTGPPQAGTTWRETGRALKEALAAKERRRERIDEVLEAIEARAVAAAERLRNAVAAALRRHLISWHLFILTFLAGVIFALLLGL